jgi:hypothetical protein
MVRLNYERGTPNGRPREVTTKMEGSIMSKQVRVALVLAALSIMMSVGAEWAIRHLTEAEPHQH